MAALSTVGRLALLGVVMVVAGCASPGEISGAPPEIEAQVGERPLATLSHGDVRDFPVAEVTWVHGSQSEVLPVFLASTPAHRSRGLMGVDSLGEVAGMVFEWPETSVGSFWMKDTLIPLQIAFIDVNGVVFATSDMDPCAAEPCPTYQPGGAYHLAFEWPAGALEVSVGDIIRLEGSSR